MKKLDLDAMRKAVLAKALEEAACRMDGQMRRIYDWTAEAAAAAGDRILLTAGQAQAVKHALSAYAGAHGADPAAAGMLSQLELSRKRYAALRATD